jgi:hypothetical protein
MRGGDDALRRALSRALDESADEAMNVERERDEADRLKGIAEDDKRREREILAIERIAMGLDRIAESLSRISCTGLNVHGSR